MPERRSKQSGQTPAVLGSAANFKERQPLLLPYEMLSQDDGHRLCALHRKPGANVPDLRRGKQYPPCCQPPPAPLDRAGETSPCWGPWAPAPRRLTVSAALSGRKVKFLKDSASRLTKIKWALVKGSEAQKGANVNMNFPSWPRVGSRTKSRKSHI